MTSGRPKRRPAPPLLPGLALAGVLVLTAFLALPFIGLLARVSPGLILQRLAEPSVQAALKLSLLTSFAATAIVVVLGLPTAYLLATREFPGKRLLEVLIDLPMVLPPTVAGFALLLAFGRMGLAGHLLSGIGVAIPFTTLAVVLAQIFMAAPFFVSPARAGFARVDPRLLEVAATLGASEARRFFRVMVPLSLPSLIAGVAMSAARSLGEFGATITFAGNLPGVTQTMPLAVYLELQSDLDTAVVLSILLLAFSFILLLGLRSAPAGWWGDRSFAPARGTTAAR
ncbi:MAG: molybdate ABC transporter permease subunit [Candidatus Eisenbacteria bacterium]|uniref:Molybdenum transport system permease n=1 Tax=Eiseniibacteriota bacterium TaxID=2212470 RepID=A0A849SFC4_UNCEI|nr:molybdate ABC transporter permease subunit [Candidatus Eisenbacteria bacterium]